MVKIHASLPVDQVCNGCTTRNSTVCYSICDVSESADDAQGLPCDIHGRFLPPGTHARPPPATERTDWTPFNSRVGFELASLLFKDAELSRPHIDRLMELWSASMIEVGGIAPLASSEDLLRQIDRIKLGHIPWKSFTAAYPSDQPVGPECPVWMREKYEVWYRDPREIVHGILGNPEFSGGIDYIPYRDFTNGQRRWSEFMSGDWAWQQAVCIHSERLTKAANVGIN